MRKILISFWRFFGMFIRTIGNFSQLLGYVVQGIGNLIEAVLGFVGKLLNKFCDKIDAKIEETTKKGKFEENREPTEN